MTSCTEQSQPRHTWNGFGTPPLPCRTPRPGHATAEGAAAYDLRQTLTHFHFAMAKPHTQRTSGVPLIGSHAVSVQGLTG
jgi:hypothetical protein